MKKYLATLRRRPMNDAGLTLPELLITMVILGIIMVALAQAFIASVHNNQATSDRIGQSHDAQLVANYVVQDAQSASGTGVSTSDSSTCGASGTAIVRLTWTSVSSSLVSTTKNVNYVLNGNKVTRYACNGSGSGSGNTRSDVASNISSAVVTCLNTTSATTCGSASTGLKIAVTEVQGSATAYNYALNAAFRKSIGTKPTPPVPNFSNLDMIVLGGSSGGTCVSYGGSSGLTLVSTNAAGINCGGSETGNATLSGSFYATGSCSSCGSNWHSPSAPVTDPYASVAYPTPGSSLGDVNCSGNLVPGTYANLTLNNNATCTLQTGTFVFTGTVSFGNNASLLGTGVLVSFTGTGNLAIGNGSSVVNLTALSTSSWPYFSILLPRTTATTVSFNGGTTTTLSGLYAPKADVTLGGNGSYTIGKLVAATVSGSGTGTYTVGTNGG